jgi:diaminopimelate epimerase
MDLKRLVIASPSGNITALVFDKIAAHKMHEVAALIQEEFPAVEQVLFVEKRGSAVHAQMAGGEFCANAARALGYILADGKRSQQHFTMSGLSSPVIVDVHPNRSKLEIQTKLQRETRSWGDGPVSIVHMEGISHAVLLPTHPLYAYLREHVAQLNGKELVKRVLDELDLTKLPASGLLFAEPNGTGTNLTPYVFVRDMGTLYAETACASGSIAVASVLGKDVSIHQPSGETLDVRLLGNGSTVKAEVDGSMSILWDGSMEYLGPEREAIVARTLNNAVLEKLRVGS